jgi:hypothetical protein
MESALRELEKAVRIQSDVVEDTRKLLARTAEHTPESQAHEVRLKFETQQRLLEAMNEKFAADIINSKLGLLKKSKLIFTSKITPPPAMRPPRLGSLLATGRCNAQRGV